MSSMPWLAGLSQTLGLARSVESRSRSDARVSSLSVLRRASQNVPAPRLIIQSPSTMVELKGEQDAEGREDDEI